MTAVPTDASSLLVELLSPVLGVPVAVEVPNPRPAAFLVVEDMGGVVRDIVVQQQQVLFQWWSDHDLVDKTYKTLFDAGLIDGFGDALPTYFPDRESKTDRWQAIMQLDLAMEELT